MALPTPAKTWQYNVNNVIAAGANDLANWRALLRAIKNALIGFGTNPWTVVYSSNSSVAGSVNDGVDRWAGDANLIWGNTAGVKSWIVLKQTGVASNFQICLSLNTAGVANTSEHVGLETVVSPNAGFTGGSTTARPTATDEAVVRAGGSQWMPTFTTAFQSVWNATQSTDGQITRIWVEYAGFCVFFLSFEKPANTVTGWTYPWASISSNEVVTTPTASCTRYAKLNDLDTNAFGSHNNVTFGLFLTSEAAVSSMIGERNTVVNSISSEFPICPITIESTTSGSAGRHGHLADIWWGSTTPEHGSTYPSGGSRTHRHVGHLIVPWNGTTPTVT